MGGVRQLVTACRGGVGIRGWHALTWDEIWHALDGNTCLVASSAGPLGVVTQEWANEPPQRRSRPGHRCANAGECHPHEVWHRRAGQGRVPRGQNREASTRGASACPSWEAS